MSSFVCKRSFPVFAYFCGATVGLCLLAAGCSSSIVVEQKKEEKKNKQPQPDKQNAEAEKRPSSTSRDTTSGETNPKEPARVSDSSDPKVVTKDDATATDRSESPDDEPATSKPATSKPATPKSGPPEAGSSEAGSSEVEPSKSGDTAETDAPPKHDNKPDSPSATDSSAAGSVDKIAEVTENRFVPAADLDTDGLMRFIIDRLQERASIQRLPGFTEGVVEAADRILASNASSGTKSSALLAKFKILHDASVAAEKGADEKLLQLAEQQENNTGRKTSAFVRFVKMERRLLDAETQDVAELPALLDDLKTYLDKEKRLDNRQLRMAMLTAEIINRLDKQKQQPLFDSLGKLYAKSVDLDLKKYGERLGKPPEVDVDRLAGEEIELTGMTTSGDKFEWSYYRGDVVIVDFWATWCGPCVQAIPEIKELHRKHAAQGLEVVGVSLDTNEKQLKNFLKTNAIPWITISGDGPQQAATRYGIRAIPTAFLIGRDGKIIDKSHRIEDLIPHLAAALAVKREEVESDAKKTDAKKVDAKKADAEKSVPK